MIVVDDLGYVKRDNAETGVLFELIAHRYERGSLVITSNHPFSTWGSIFVDETMAVAAADRLIHHGYMFELKGENYVKLISLVISELNAIALHFFFVKGITCEIYQNNSQPNFHAVIINTVTCRRPRRLRR